jgi:putative salt-induced outer membrane protein YdiY
MDLRLRRAARRLLAAAVVAAPLTLPALAEDAPKETGWKDSAELSYVVTAGNAETSTFGFKNKLWRKWARTAFELNASGVRAESTTVTRTVDPGPPPAIVETPSSDLKAEAYALNGRFDRTITEHLFWFAGAGWDRNRFAGIQNRYFGFGGVGNIWKDEERVKFRTDYGLTITRQDDVIDNPAVDDTFAGARFSADYMHKLGAATTFTSRLVLDENLNETSDWRADWTNAATVTMSTHLGLKVSLQWLYDHEPSLVAVDDPGDLLPPAGPTALTPLDDLDTIFTTSLVITW